VTIWTLKCPIPLVNAVHSGRLRASATKHEFRLTLTVNAAMNRERKANLVGLATGMGLVVLWVFLYAAIGQFF
jgi:hypothetical protein